MSDYALPLRKVNLKVDRGTTMPSFTFTANYADGTPYDLTGATVVGIIRDADDANVGELACTVEAPLDGEIRVGMTAAATAAMVVGHYNYDVVVTLGDGVTVLPPLIGGEFRVKKTYSLL